MLDEQLVLDGDGAYNAHFGESMAALGDIDDDGFPGQCIFLEDVSGAVSAACLLPGLMLRTTGLHGICHLKLLTGGPRSYMLWFS